MVGRCTIPAQFDNSMRSTASGAVTIDPDSGPQTGPDAPSTNLLTSGGQTSSWKCRPRYNTFQLIWCWTDNSRPRHFKRGGHNPPYANVKRNGLVANWTPRHVPNVWMFPYNSKGWTEMIAECDGSRRARITKAQERLNIFQYNQFCLSRSSTQN